MIHWKYGNVIHLDEHVITIVTQGKHKDVYILCLLTERNLLKACKHLNTTFPYFIHLFVIISNRNLNLMTYLLPVYIPHY